MSMILITGTPGSGKTLFAVSKIVKWLAEGRKVYADIDGLNIEGVEKSPDDWRTTPEGSVIVYDEAQQKDIFKKTRSTLSDNKIISDFEIHRHTGHDIVFITQSPIFLHTHIRELIGEHFHLHRPYGAKLANVYFWRLCQNNPNTKTAKSVVESTSLFSYDKKLFNYYKSATIHTHKLRIPSRLLFMIIGCIVAAGVIYYFAKHSHYLMGKPSESALNVNSQPVQTNNSTPNTPTTTSPQILNDPQTKELKDKMQELYSHNLELINYNPILHVSGVILTETSCKAFNEYGEILNMSYSDCLQNSSHVVAGRTRGNDLRSNAHQGNEQQNTQNQNPSTNQT